MKTRYRLITLIGASALLSGCFMGELANRGELTPPKPYISYWEKLGMTEEGRQVDWAACGGKKNGDFSLNPNMLGETNEQSDIRQRREFQRCLISRGYRYTGTGGACTLPDRRGDPICTKR